MWGHTSSVPSTKQYVISIYRMLCQSVSQSVFYVLFVPGEKTICLSPGGQIFLTHRRGGDKHFFTHRGGDKIVLLEALVPMLMLMKRWL